MVSPPSCVGDTKGKKENEVETRQKMLIFKLLVTLLNPALGLERLARQGDRINPVNTIRRRASQM